MRTEGAVVCRKATSAEMPTLSPLGPVSTASETERDPRVGGVSGLPGRPERPQGPSGGRREVGREGKTRPVSGCEDGRKGLGPRDAAGGGPQEAGRRGSAALPAPGVSPASPPCDLRPPER